MGIVRWRTLTLIEEFITHSSQVEGTWHTMPGHTGKYYGRSGGRRNYGRLCAKAFIVVFTGRNGQSKVNIRIGWFE